jgi:hypothetical protein
VFSFRKLELGNFLRQPLDWMHAMILSRLYQVYEKSYSKPVNTLQREYEDKMSQLCYGKISEWDELMIKLLKGTY